MRRILLPVLWMLLLLSMAVTIALNFRPLYYHDISSLKIEETSGFSKKVITSNYDALIDYNSLLNRKPLKLSLPMSREGRIHFEEVKKIFDGVQIIFLVSLILSVIFGYQQWKRRDLTFLKHGSILSIAIPLIVGSAISVNWDQAFVTFHEIFFQNDYWIFDSATDPVIDILPDEFFLHCAILAISLVILGCILSFVLYKICSSFYHKTML